MQKNKPHVKGGLIIEFLAIHQELGKAYYFKSKIETLKSLSFKLRFKLNCFLYKQYALLLTVYHILRQTSLCHVTRFLKLCSQLTHNFFSTEMWVGIGAKVFKYKTG